MAKQTIVENIHRDSLLDSLIGKTVEIHFMWGEVATGRLEWIEKPCEFKHQKYALIRPMGGGISFYKSHVKRVNGIEVR